MAKERGCVDNKSERVSYCCERLLRSFCFLSDIYFLQLWFYISARKLQT